MLTDTTWRADTIKGETCVYFSNTRGGALENTNNLDHDFSGYNSKMHLAVLALQAV